MNILDRVKETFVDGPGIRYSIYIAGCDKHCDSCHNPDSWSFESGYTMTDEVIEEIVSEYKSNPMLDGFTILGGEPLHKLNIPGMNKLVRRLKQVTDNVWIYTGYTLEELFKINPNNINLIEILCRITILVDGPFIESLKTEEAFIGSSNQRFIKTEDMFRLNKILKEVDINDYVTR